MGGKVGWPEGLAPSADGLARGPGGPQGNFKAYPDFFIDFSFIYQLWVNGLDLNRFCAAEHIIQMSNSSIFGPFGEKSLFHPNYYFSHNRSLFSNSSF